MSTEMPKKLQRNQRSIPTSPSSRDLDVFSVEGIGWRVRNEMRMICASHSQAQRGKTCMGNNGSRFRGQCGRFLCIIRWGTVTIGLGANLHGHGSRCLGKVSFIVRGIKVCLKFHTTKMIHLLTISLMKWPLHILEVYRSVTKNRYDTPSF